MADENAISTFCIKILNILLFCVVQSIRMSKGIHVDLPSCTPVQYGTNYEYKSGQSDYLKYVCIDGLKDSSIWAIWSDVELMIVTEQPQSVKFITGQSCQEVIEKHRNETLSSWFFTWFKPNSWFSLPSDDRTSMFALPYGRHCYAIIADNNFTLNVTFHGTRLLYPMLMLLGIALFFNANEVSRSVFFYYSSGVSVGMILSILLLVFVISRLIPKRSIGYAFLMCGSSAAAFFLQLIIRHFTGKPFESTWVIFSYFIISGVISFLYCYYRGPVTSERGFDLLRWGLQSFALFLVYYSIRSPRIAFVVLFILIATRWISVLRIIRTMSTYTWMPYRVQAYFISKPKLISLEEYEQEGREQTAKALSLLREHCESPDCDKWKVISRLKSPKRFASFVAGQWHTTDEEEQVYEDASFDQFPNFMTSDEDSDIDLATMDLDFAELPR